MSFSPLASLAAVAAFLASAHAVDFSHEIVPLLRKHCGDCHTGDKLKGGFSLNDRAALLHGSENGPVLDLKAPDQSLLLELITTSDLDLRMPPKGPGLSAEEAARIQEWVRAGAPWEEGFAFQTPAYEPPLKPRVVSLPPATDHRDHPVDRILDAYLAQKGIPRPPRIDDGAFLRRAHLDLIGLLPTPEERDAFLADSHPDKRARLVRSLLARETDYTEHWLTFWNDLLRNDYGGTGFITGGRKQISGWLYESLISNKPFDQFARELLAPVNGQSQGFIDGIKWRGEVSAGQTVEIQFAQSVGQSFLGINLKCASCHDSFVDRWKLDEAYGLAAIYADKPLEVHRCDKPVGRTATASWLFPELGQVDPAAPRPQRLQQLAALMTHPENGRFLRTLVNRLWHRLMGHGIVHPLDAMQSEPWNADLLDYLAVDFQESGYDLKHVLERIATAEIYQTQVVTESDPHGPYVFSGPRPRRLTAEQFIDSVWQLTGTAPAKMDAPVLRGRPSPEAIASATSQLTGTWIWGSSAHDGQAPPAGESIVLRANWKLPAPVAAGAAILSCDNEFVLFLNGRRVAESGNWAQLSSVPLTDQLKAGDNQIVVIATNQGSSPNPAGLFFQAEAKLTDGSSASLASGPQWEFNPQVPAGKEGRLGSLTNDWKPAVIVPAVGPWSAMLQQQGPTALARGLTGEVRMVRASLMKSNFLMRTLGRPNRDQIVSMRPEELTTLEAIDLSNGEILSAALAAGAERLAKRPWKDSAEFVDWLYAHALARAPNESERDAALEVLGAEKPAPSVIADVLWAVLMQPEFQYVQ